MAQPQLLKHRLHVSAPLTTGDVHTLTTDSYHYLRHVLRLQSGSTILSFDNCGQEFVSEYESVTKTIGQLHIGDCTRKHSFQGPELHLGLCLIKGAAFDYALQKITELGVTHIWPLVSERTTVRLRGSRLERKFDHWWGVVISAAEQCGRLTVPQVNKLQPLNRYLETVNNPQQFVLDPSAATTVTQAETINTSLLIGPEGGFSDQEIVLCHQCNYLGWRLGTKVLRADTAGVAALAVLQQMMEWPS